MKSCPVRSGSGGEIGSAGDMNTAPRTRSGCSTASSSAAPAGAQWQTTTASSTPAASITASASPAVIRWPYASGLCGRSERPFPRASYVTTRKWRARYGTWSFQKREWTIAHGERKSRVSGPSPKTS